MKTKFNILFAPAEFTFSNRANSKTSWFYWYLKALLKLENVTVTAIFDNVDPNSAFTHPKLTTVVKNKRYNPKPSTLQVVAFQLWLIPTVIKLQKKQRFTHIHHFGTFGNRTSFNLPLLLGVFKQTPFIFGPLEENVTENAMWVSVFEKTLIKIIYPTVLKTLVKKTLHKSNDVICISTVAKNYYNEIYPNFNSFHVCTPGIDLSYASNKNKNFTGGIRTVTACNLIPFKRVDSIIKIFSTIKPELHDLYLDIIGDGKELQNLLKTVEALPPEISNRITFHGHVKPEKVSEILSSSHIYLNMSQYESYGQAMLEASLNGLVVIATDNPGPREFLIQRLLVNRDMMARMSETATKYIRENFDWDIIVKQYIQIYEKSTNHIL